MDVGDAFPVDPTEWSDTDGDGIGDNSDASPNDPTVCGPYSFVTYTSDGTSVTITD